MTAIRPWISYGTELPDIYTARDQAARMGGEIPRDLGARFWDCATGWKLEVADERSRPLFILRVSVEENVAGQ